MNVHAAGDLKFTGLTRPNGAPLRLNDQDFVAIDRDKNAKYEATYRPQALCNRANKGFHANNETFLLHEVATNLPIYRPDTGPTDFHLHLPPGGFQLVLVTSGAFTFDYDGRLYNVGPGAAMLQSAIVHRQLFYTWSGLSTEENLKTPQTVVPDPISMGYSGKFLEAFITDPTTFPNPVAIYRVIRGAAEFKKKTGETFDLSVGDIVTAGKDSISLIGVSENTQVLRLGLLKGMNELRSWTPTQRDEIDGLAGQIITQKDVRPLRTEGKPVGYLYG